MPLKSIVIIVIFLILSSLFWAGMAGAEGDKTPYIFIFGGNSYSGTRNATAAWLADRFDIGIAGVSDWPYLFDSIYDIRKGWSPPGEFICGPYVSTQELNLYQQSHPEYTYAQRLADPIHWLVAYAEHYMDSIGVDVESLYVHYADTFVNITQDGDGQRIIGRMDTLSQQKTRFTYQYWNNTSADPVMYPQGYTWLANGLDGNTRKALAYAFRRYIFEDSANSGPNYPGDHHWTGAFSDNQYRDGAGGDSASPRLPSYYDGAPFVVAGGPTANLDWDELPNLTAVNLRYYYDNSTLLIDSTIDAVWDSVSAANGASTILGGPLYHLRISNVDKTWPNHFGYSIKQTSCLLENPLDYTKGWSNFRAWFAISDTMRGRDSGTVTNQRYLAWMFLTDFLSDEGTWRKLDRMTYAHYAFYLNMYEPNIFCGPFRFNDSTRWRGIYEVNFGQPIAPRDSTNKTGSGSTAIFVLKRFFDHNYDTSIILMRSAHGTADYVNDSIPVSLGRNFYEVDVNGDTAVSPVSSVYLHPYEGWIGIRNAGLNASPSIDSIGPDTGTVDVQTTFGLLASDAKGGEFVACGCYAITPSDDSSDIFSRTYVSAHHASPIDTTFTYTPTEAGAYTIGCRVIDDSSAVTSDYIIFNVSAAEPPPEGSSLGGRVRMRK